MAVYTEVTDQDIEAFLALYDIGQPVSLKGIAEGVENSNYFLLTTQAPYILTLYEKRVEEKDLPFFLGLTEHLAQHGIPCPLPVHARDGKLYRAFKGRPAAVISFLLGKWPKVIQDWQLAPLGTALAQMHRAAEGFALTRANALGLPGWHTLYHKIKDGLDGIEPGLKKLVSDELYHLDAHWPKALPQGVIHADLFPDNVFFEDGKLSGLIDFYFACNDALAYDLAVCINAWCFAADGTFNAEHARALAQAYHTGRALSDAERAAIPILCRGAALRFLLTRAHDLIHHDKSALVMPKNPLEYAAKLRFHQRATIGSYGV
ncbi:MAG: homoserine kinase [Alphaproteobacteria bacterium]|nr:homoserine kinase [Alphaproteobacteria bacterium]